MRKTMKDGGMENNGACITGRILPGAVYSHEMYGERFYRADILACCDTSGRATCIDEVGRGTVNYCPGTIQEIFKAAVISNATNIFMFHNHPSGDPSPSRADKDITKKIQEAGELMDIRLLDHIIIGRDGAYYSFRENGEISGNSDGE